MDIAPMIVRSNRLWVVCGLLNCLAAAQSVAAQEASDSVVESPDSVGGGSSLLPLPFVFYTPETSTAFGATLNIISRFGDGSQNSRPSVFRPVVLYTVNKQFILSLQGESYFRHDVYRVFGWAAYQRFPTSFWGVGNDTPDDAEEDFTPRRVAAQFEFHKRFTPTLYAGAMVFAAHRKLVDTEPGGALATRAIEGVDDGRAIGVGVLVTFDDRDNIVFPRGGGFQQVKVIGFGGVTGSSYDFSNYSLDLRRYIPMGDEAVVAIRATGLFTTGTPPFELLHQLGGELLLRGYFGGRFRDRNLVALQGELRTPLWWRIGAVAFLEAGRVAGSLSEFSVDGVKTTYGAGLRFLFDQREGLSLRLDYALAPGSSAFYLGIGEVF